MIKLTRKSLLISLIAIIVLALSAYIVYGALTTITVTQPTNATEFYSRTSDIGGTFNFNLTTNELAENCTLYVENTTSSWFMTNNSGDVVNTTFTNMSIIWTFPSRGDDSPLRAWTAKCEVGTTRVWLNTSATAGFYYFKINERAANSILITNVTPIGGSFQSANISLNITVNETMANCFFMAGYTNNTQTALTSMTNGSASHLWFTNASHFSNTPSTYDGWHNLTFYCNDSFGNGTWYNTSATSGWLLYRSDIIVPVVNDTLFFISNSTSGNWVNFSFLVTDTYINSTYMVIYKPDATTAEKNATYIRNRTTDNTSRYYQVNLTSSDLALDGVYVIGLRSVDSGGLIGNSTNTTLVVTNLKSGKWNLVTFNNNITMGNIPSLVYNISYVSIFDNRLGYKNFTTFQAGLSTNSGTMVNETLNATMVYSVANVVLIRNYSRGIWNIPSAANVTLMTGGWNYVGFSGTNSTNLNASIYGHNCGNVTYRVTNASITFTGNGTGNTSNTNLTASYPKIVRIISVGNGSTALLAGNYTYNETYMWFLWSGYPLYSDINVTNVAYNVTYDGTFDLVTQPYCANITYSSWYNGTNWCSAKSGWNITSCGSGYGPLDITIRAGSGLWLLTNQNMTFNRSVSSS